MWNLSTPTGRVEVVTPPATEPISLAEARRQVHVAESDTTYDNELTLAIQASREQWESDTDTAVITQTLRLYGWSFYGWSIELPRRPVQSVTSVLYYDATDTQQTLSTNIYALDTPARTIRLKDNEVWPTVALNRYDGITVTYVAGYTSASAVPAIWKQAMLLLVGYYFSANRGDNDRVNDQRAYERLVGKFMRTTHP